MTERIDTDVGGASNAEAQIGTEPHVLATLVQPSVAIVSNAQCVRVSTRDETPSRSLRRQLASQVGRRLEL